MLVMLAAEMTREDDTQMSRTPRWENVGRPSLADLAWARATFEAAEPRDLFYRLATYLMVEADREGATFSKAEALAVLLQSWNRSYYQRLKIAFNAAHFAGIEHLLVAHADELGRLGARSIESLESSDESPIRTLYRDFAVVLGQTGASKALHMLAPRFCPLWDGFIAERAYGLYARDARDYWRLVWATAEQVKSIGGEAALGRNPIKAIDEYNYCRYTLGKSPVPEIDRP
jgi:hypothetical protein